MFDKVCLVSTIDKLGKAWIWCFYLLDLLECGQVASVWYAFTFQKVQCTWILRCVCFGWKWLQEIIFPQIQAFGSDGKFHFPENSFLLIEIFTFDPKMIFHPHLHFNSFPEKEREREKRKPRSEREWEKREPRSESTDRRSRRSSDDRTAPTSGVINECDRWDCAVRLSERSHRSSIDERRHRRDRAVQSSGWSHRLIVRMIASLVDRRAAIAPVVVDSFSFAGFWFLLPDLMHFAGFWLLVVDDFFLGYGLCFSRFVFSFFFSKHQKIFSGKFVEMQPNT